MIRARGDNFAVHLDTTLVDHAAALATGGDELEVGEQLGQVDATFLGVILERDVEDLDVLGNAMRLEDAIELLLRIGRGLSL